MPKEIKVKLKTSNGRIQLVYSYQGKRNYLSLGLSDTPVNRRLAALKAAEIEQDILFDRYRGMDYYKGIEPAETPVIRLSPEFYLNIWHEWIEYKYTVVNRTTKGSYEYTCTVIDRCPFVLDNAINVRNWLLSQHTFDVSQRIIDRLIACFNWAIAQNKIDFNPYVAHKLIGKGGNSKRDINPFTADERDLIILRCGESEHYKYYKPLIEFIFFTGCRPSEAIALRWIDLSADRTRLTFQQAATKGEKGQIRVKAGLKTQKSRRIFLNDKVRQIIDDVENQNGSDDALVFPAKYGGVINWPNFRHKAWSGILATCDGIEYRNPYQMRHTFITLALRSGMPVADVASLVGNSAEVIYKHYAGVSRDLILPDI